MKENIKTQNWLAKWLVHELSEEDMTLFHQNEDFDLYQKISEYSLNLEIIPADIKKKFEEQLLYNETYEKNVSKKLKRIIYPIAASLLLLFTLWLGISRDDAIETQYAQKMEISLPDNSKVFMNTDSKIVYNKKNFLKTRFLKFEGEGYFEVSKGSTFKIKTSNGSIKVLGTKFNVFSRDGELKVFCNEGSVRVSDENNSVVLTENQGAIAMSNLSLSLQSQESSSPQWRFGKNHYNKTPLKKVITELERQFDIEIDATNIDSNRLYSGLFYHKNMNEALATVFEPMNIEYDLKENSNQLFLKNK